MLINKYIINGFSLSIYDSITDISCKLWDKTIAYEHPFRSHSFLSAVEKSFNSRIYRYFLVRQTDGNQDIVGIFFGTKDKLDVLFNLPRVLQYCLLKIRCLFPKCGFLDIAMLGNYETMGKHWWFINSFDSKTAIAIIVNAIENEFVGTSVVVIRDIEKCFSDFDSYDNYLSSNGFNKSNNYPLAVIMLGNINWSKHCNRLRSNCRKVLLSAMKRFSQSDFSVKHYSNLTYSMEALYTQYLNTHSTATEYKREALPLSFFYNVIAKCDIILSVLYDHNDNEVAFIFSGVNYKMISPFIFGRKKTIDNKINAYSVLHFDLLDQYVTPRTEMVDLGITNYHMKQNFGAILVENFIYIKLSNDFLNSYIGRLVANFFDVKKPIERMVFKKI